MAGGIYLLPTTIVKDMIFNRDELLDHRLLGNLPFLDPFWDIFKTEKLFSTFAMPS